MGQDNPPGDVRTFDPADYPMKLRMPSGKAYVDGATTDQIREALQAGYAVYVEGCDGKAFVWKQDDRYEADQFYAGPAREKHFETVDEAADFAASMCE